MLQWHTLVAQALTRHTGLEVRNIASQCYQTLGLAPWAAGLSLVAKA